MTFKEYKKDPKVGTRSYRGINLTPNQIFIPVQTSQEFVKDYAVVLVFYDKNKRAIKLRFSKLSYDNALPVRLGVSYAHYIPCRIAITDGMPTGRYYVESHEAADDKSGDYEVVFKHTNK